ncbi:MAG: ABC transporter ATP-binding protein [Gammaproteobacteria bacterium]|nr:ABC transporter ATP-binding protein [Gammaproteobacteria bacterium]NIR85672.1 ABC transporter ATP-binding protein [Gammaproteobacteria bacterium]NIR90160.1 ABC transporter ATP-binding protein [Gammaproteobacteria bacterium]NIU06806.1 ABC transporter ATP-binding protein [Gammaproteobacteria bacterium]NIV53739.1 polyamine ABC transporter ATP-binding protein [Gammaproteobacteria bacterium]
MEEKTVPSTQSLAVPRQFADRSQAARDATGGVRVRDLTKIFGTGPAGVRALDGVSIDIREGEFFTLLGPSGCGKTTLLRLIAGFEQPSAGEIRLDGRDVSDLPPYRRPVNTVFQNYALFPHMTVADNVAFGLQMQRLPRRTVAARVREMLALVKLSGLEARKPAELSGGQQQRVALARALANNPRVLLLDEPLSALDLKLRKEMQIELKRLKAQTGVTFVFVTHDQGEALTMSDRVAVMHEGRILQTGTPEQIYERPTRRFVADFIGETNFLEATLEEAAERHALFRLPSGACLQGADPRGHRAGERVTLAVRPERMALCAAGTGRGLSARVEDVIYFGTDTVYYVRLEREDERLSVRTQNKDGDSLRFTVGAQVEVSVAPASVQVLAD